MPKNPETAVRAISDMQYPVGRSLGETFISGFVVLFLFNSGIWSDQLEPVCLVYLVNKLCFS